MNRLLKILTALASLILVAGTLIALLVDLDVYKDDISARFAAATGRTLVISGHLRISLLPRPVLAIERVAIPGSLGGAGPALAELDLLELYPRLPPLLAGRIELALVRMEGLRLHLVRDEQGRANWDVFAAAPSPVGRLPSTIPRLLATPLISQGSGVLAAESGAASAGFVSDSVEILDGLVTWDDRQAGWQGKLDELEILAGPIRLRQPVAWRMSGVLVQGDGNPDAELRGEARLSIEEGWRRLRLEGLTLGLAGLGLGQGIAANLQLQTSSLEGDLAGRRYEADKVMLKTRFFGAALSAGPIDATTSARLALDLGAEHLQLDRLSIRSGALSAQGRILGQTLLSAPVLTGDLVVGQIDLRAWLEGVGLRPPRTASPETFRRFALETCWRYEEGWLDLQDLEVGIDQTRLRGEIQRFAASPDRYRFDLVADHLDLDHYLPRWGRARADSPKTSELDNPQAMTVALQTGSAQEATVPAATHVAPASASVRSPVPARLPITLDSIGNLDLDGRLRITELDLAGLRLGDADMRIRGEDGSLDIEDQVLRFYEGILGGRLALDVRGGEPRVSLTQRAESVQSGLLLADLSFGDRLEGRAEIVANLATRGRSVEALRRNLVGNLSIHITDGMIKGVSLERLVGEAEARLQGKSPPRGLPPHTVIRELRASGEVQDAVLSNRDLVATTDHLRITGVGTFDLARKRVDYRLEPVLITSPGGHGSKELKGIPIPVHLTGPFDHPQWDVDVASAVRAAAQRRLEGHGSDLFEKLEKRTGIKGLEQGLKSLFGP